MADTAERIYKLTVQADQALRELGKLNTAAKRSEESLSGIAKAAQSFNQISGLIGKAGAAIGAAFAAIGTLRAITDASDQINTLRGSFDALLGSTERAVDMLELVKEIAQTTGAPLQDVGGAARRLSVALGEIGASNNEIAQITENFIMLGRVGGSSMADISGALLQFTQALASGRLQGDELRSIMERVPGIVQLIAKEMNVTVGEVKELGSQGLITADVMRSALLSATEEVAASFAKLPSTFEQATNRLANQWTITLAAIDKSVGVSRALVAVFDELANVLRVVTAELDASNQSASALRSAFEGIGTVIEVVGRTIKMIVDLAFRWVDALNTLYRLLMSVGTFNWAGISDALTGYVARTKEWALALVGVQQQAIGAAKAMRDVQGARDSATEAKADPDNVFNTLTYGMREAERAAKETAIAIDVLKRSGFDEEGKREKASRSRATKAKEEKQAVEELLTVYQRWDLEIAAAAVEVDNASSKLFYFSGVLDELNRTGQGETSFATVLKKQIDELAGSLDPLVAFTNSAKAAQDEADRTADKIDILFRLLALGPEGGGISSDVFDQMMSGLTKLEASADTAAKATTTFMDDLSRNASQAGNTFIDGFVDKLVEGNDAVTKSFGALVESMLKTMAKLLLSTIFQNFIKALTNWGFAAFGMGSSPTGSQPAQAAANGAAFNRGQVMPFASGGILSQPTFFPMAAGRIGLAGEAGPEAIVPLRRSNGVLGVGASPVTVNVNNTVSNDTQAAVSVKDNADGSRTVDVLIERKVKAMFDSGAMDKQMRSSYGVTRQAMGA